MGLHGFAWVCMGVWGLGGREQWCAWFVFGGFELIGRVVEGRGRLGNSSLECSMGWAVVWVGVGNRGEH